MGKLDRWALGMEHWMRRLATTWPVVYLHFTAMFYVVFSLTSHFIGPPNSDMPLWHMILFVFVMGTVMTPFQIAIFEGSKMLKKSISDPSPSNHRA